MSTVIFDFLLQLAWQGKSNCISSNNKANRPTMNTKDPQANCAHGYLQRNVSASNLRVRLPRVEEVAGRLGEVALPDGPRRDRVALLTVAVLAKVEHLHVRGAERAREHGRAARTARRVAVVENVAKQRAARVARGHL